MFGEATGPNGNGAFDEVPFDVVVDPVSVHILEMRPGIDSTEYDILSDLTVPIGNGVKGQSWQVQPRLPGGSFGPAVTYSKSRVVGKPGDKLTVHKSTCNGPNATAQATLMTEKDGC